MKRLLFLFLILAGGLRAQNSAYTPQLISYPGVPTGSCSIYQQAINTSNGNLYTCNMAGNATIGTWAASSSGSGITQVATLPGTCTAGSQYQITGTNSYFICGPANTFTQVALGAQTSAPPMGFYLTNQCPTANTSFCFYAPANTLQFNNCSYTSGSPTVNCATGVFTASMNGYRIFGYSTCSAFANGSISLPMTASAALTLTYVSATQVTLSANASNTVSGNTHCVIVGSPDDTGATAMDTAAQAATQCPKLMFAAAYFMFTTPHFYVQPTACANLGSNYPASTGAGNMLYAAGYELEGRGTGTSVWFLTPGFPETGNCLHGLSSLACFVVVTEGRWTNLQITGGGNYTTPAAHTNIVEVDGPASLDNFTCINFGANGFNSIGVAAYLWTQLTQVNISECGSVAVATNISSSVTAIRLSIDNPNTIGLALGALSDYYTFSPFQFDRYNFICYDCRVFGGVLNGTGQILVDNIGMKLKMYHSTISPYDSTGTGLIGYQCATTAGCLLDAEDTFIDMTQAGMAGSTGDIGIKCLVACVTNIKNSIVKGTVGTSSYTDVTGSTFVNLGNNIWGATNTFAGTAYAFPDEAGTVACSTGSATITFKGTYINSPIVTVWDHTTAGVVTQTSLSNTTGVYGCPAASDALNYIVAPNPI